jgi:hypothetical protein
MVQDGVFTSDYGYEVTSHSSQGATADRVLVHVDTDQAHEQLINSRLAYVSVSRGRYDVQIYTNDAGKLGEELSRDVSKQSALGAEHGMRVEGRGQATENADRQSLIASYEIGKGYAIERRPEGSLRFERERKTNSVLGGERSEEPAVAWNFRSARTMNSTQLALTRNGLCFHNYSGVEVRPFKSSPQSPSSSSPDVKRRVPDSSHEGVVGQRLHRRTSQTRGETRA